MEKRVFIYAYALRDTQKENRTPLLVSVDCTHLLSIKSQRFFVVPFTSTNIDRARVGRQKKRASKKLYNSFEGLVDRIRRDACCVFGAFFLSLEIFSETKHEYSYQLKFIKPMSMPSAKKNEPICMTKKQQQQQQ